MPPQDPFRWLSLDRSSVVTLEAQLSRQMAILIASGQINPHDRLPPLRAIAEQLDVNQLTVRAAYRRLEDQGLISLQQGRGTTVISDGLVQLAADRRDHRSFTIGVILPAFEDGFYAPLLRGMREAARGDPSQLLLGEAGDDPASALVYLRQLVARDVDGVIIVSQVIEGLEELDTSQLPPLVFGDIPGSKPPSVVFGLEAIETAIRHLTDHGHQSIGLLSPGDHHPPARAMAQEFMEVQGRTDGLDSRTGVIELADWRSAAGERAVASLLASENRPSALITASEEIATGVLRQLRSSGLGVPDDLALIAIGGTSIAPLIDPALTTIDLPTGAMGLRLMEMLLASIAGEAVPIEAVSLKSTLTIRASCGTHD